MLTASFYWLWEILPNSKNSDYLLVRVREVMKCRVETCLPALRHEGWWLRWGSLSARAQRASGLAAPGVTPERSGVQTPLQSCARCPDWHQLPDRKTVGPRTDPASLVWNCNILASSKLVQHHHSLERELVIHFENTSKAGVLNFFQTVCGLIITPS